MKYVLTFICRLIGHNTRKFTWDYDNPPYIWCKRCGKTNK